MMDTRVPRPGRAYVPRLVDGLIAHASHRFAATLVVGPRAVGKTTTAQRIARTVVRLDRPRDAQAFRDDPDIALASLDEPVLLDEWQEVPDVLGAVKRAVDDDPRPGRFILTGSVRARLDVPTWPGTGRLIHVRMEPLTVVERTGGDLGDASSIIDRLFEEGGGWLTGRRSGLTLDSYLEAAFAGGWPPLIDLAEADRRAWLAGYVEHIVTRDAHRVSGGTDSERLRSWLQAYGANVATVTDQKRIYEAAGVAKATGESYADLMEALMILTPLPAWWTNELKRLAKRPKLHLVDPALLGPLLGLDSVGALRTARHGPVVESLVVAQLRALAGVASVPTRLFHLRHLDGREVNIVLERPDRRIVAIEVKSASAPTTKDADNLRWLRDRWGDRVACGIVAHTGPLSFDLSDGIIACPIESLLGTQIP